MKISLKIENPGIEIFELTIVCDKKYMTLNRTMKKFRLKEELNWHFYQAFNYEKNIFIFFYAQ